MEPNTRFIELRKRLNLTQLELSEKLDVSRSTIADIERGSIPISKRVMAKMSKELDIEIGYFDEKKTTNNVKKNEGIEIGSNEGIDTKNDKLKTNVNHKNKHFPEDYFQDENKYLKSNFEKKLLIDIIHNHKQVNELHNYLNVLSNFEFIIDNLNYYYFSNVDLQFHSSLNYLKNSKFDYDTFKADFIKEIEKMEVIRPALSKIAKAIEDFYTEIKEFDTENIISGYFGKKPDDTTL